MKQKAINDPNRKVYPNTIADNMYTIREHIDELVENTDRTKKC